MRKFGNNTIAIMLAGAAVIAAGGCNMGPEALPADRGMYNAAVQQSGNEQLLLNMVRLKYREPMTFLQISSISSHRNYSANASGSVTIPEAGMKVFSPSAGTSYSEQPTLTYTTLEGEEFASRILTETDMSTFTLLARGGWSVEHLMRIMVERLGELQNYPTTGAEHKTDTEYERFVELACLWAKLQSRGDLNFMVSPGEPVVVAENIPADDVAADTYLAADESGYSLTKNPDGGYRMTKPGTPSLVVRIKYADKSQADRADELLGASPPRKRFDGGVVEKIELVSSHEATKHRRPGQVPIQLRSYSDMLYYVAQGIQTPPGHVEAGLIKKYKDTRGRVIDRRRLTKDLLDVRYSRSRPAGAFLAVKHRDGWFYIADGDVGSKDAFALLKIIFALQSKAPSGGQPVLTIPVSG